VSRTLSPVRVRCMYPFDSSLQARLRRSSEALEFSFTAPDGQAQVDAIDDPTIEVLLSNSCPSNLDRFPKLRWLALAGAGIEHLVAKDPWSRGITVTNGSGLHASPMAEYALGAFLWFSQGFARREANQGQRGWPAPWGPAWIDLLGSPLRGRTLTVVGYGSIGREIARVASAFGMRVIAVKARPAQRADAGYAPPGVGDPSGTIPERIVGPEALADVFAVSQFVAISIPWTPATDKLIGRETIGALPREAVVVNVARGRVVDEAALIEAVASGKIRGAALDVLATEPPDTKSPVWTTPNIILTPHVSGANDPSGGWDALAALMGENLSRYASKRPLLNVADPRTGY
jgi:phosphoglycerate dehydrogenase-like enzyme